MYIINKKRYSRVLNILIICMTYPPFSIKYMYLSLKFDKYIASDVEKGV